MVIQFSPQSYKRVDGIEMEFLEIIKKNNDRLSLARYILLLQLQQAIRSLP